MKEKFLERIVHPIYNNLGKMISKLRFPLHLIFTKTILRDFSGENPISFCSTGYPHSKNLIRLATKKPKITLRKLERRESITVRLAVNYAVSNLYGNQESLTSSIGTPGRCFEVRTTSLLFTFLTLGVAVNSVERNC